MFAVTVALVVWELAVVMRPTEAAVAAESRLLN